MQLSSIIPITQVEVQVRGLFTMVERFSLDTIILTNL